MDHLRIATVFVASVALAAVSSCRVEGGLGGPSVPSRTAQPQPAQPEPASPQGPPPADPQAGGGSAGVGVAGGPSCQHADNHCLDPDVMFVGKKAWQKRYVYVEAAKMTAEPDASGEAKFLVLKDGAETSSPHFYRTYRPDPSQLQVGQMVVMLHAKSGKVYRAPKDKEDALGKRWWLTRIISLAPLAQAGEVIVAGGYKVRAEALRLIEGDEKETVVVKGTEDAHFLTPEHWLISKNKLPNKGYKYATIAAAIQPPSAQTKGDGHFVDLNDGHSVWTKNNWRTRPATKQDIKLGKHVFVLHAKDQDGNYRAPRSRSEALSKRWWIAKVTDDSELYKNSVTIAGKYRANLDGLRVIAE